MALGPETMFTLAGLCIAIALHAGLTVIGVRFLRIRLATRWAPVLYALFFLPLVLLPTTILFGGLLATGALVLDPGALIALLFVLPIGLGLAIDFFWLPPPEVVDTPREAEGSR
ncbi:MAG: hypothetical protein ABEJ35_03555 [Halobacteriaceae archaeon]